MTKRQITLMGLVSDENEVISLSERVNYISFFSREGDDKLYIFNGSLVNFQSLYKTPLRILTLNSGAFYTTMKEIKVVSSFMHNDHELVKTKWGYEYHMKKSNNSI